MGKPAHKQVNDVSNKQKPAQEQVNDASKKQKPAQELVNDASNKQMNTQAQNQPPQEMNTNPIYPKHPIHAPNAKHDTNAKHDANEKVEIERYLNDMRTKAKRMSDGDQAIHNVASKFKNK